MTEALTEVVVRLNAAADGLGGVLLAPVGVLPGWLSATLIAAASGVFFLLLFKYTSHQTAIRRVRNDINANLLTLKLFTDSAAVALRAQAGLLAGAGRLLVLAAVPMLVMALPAALLLAQLALWFEARPLRVGEEAVVTVRLRDPGPAWPDVRLEPNDAAKLLVGPVRVTSQREVCWNLKAVQPGYHRLVFHVGAETADKEWAVGDGLMRVSLRRPGRRWDEALANPHEPPTGPSSLIDSIAVDYPQRAAFMTGAGTWPVYWFVVAMVSGLCFRRVLNVNV